jgi:hypothetical protein
MIVDRYNFNSSVNSGPGPAGVNAWHLLDSYYPEAIDRGPPRLGHGVAALGWPALDV